MASVTKHSNSHAQLGQMAQWNWSFFNQGQKVWPIPGPLLLFAFFSLGVVGPLFGGRIGIVAAFLLSACYPTGPMKKYYSSGDLVKIISIVASVMMLGNLDALGDLLGSDVFRFSWIALGLAGMAILSQSNLIKGRLSNCCAVLTLLACFHIMTTLGNTSIIRGIELNGSYMAAFILTTICLNRRQIRDTLVMQLCLFMVLNCGFCFFEILFPSSQVTISSSRIAEETVRSAGIYANAIVSGVMSSGVLLLATVSCTRLKPSAKEKRALLVLTILCSVGVLVTFSRSAAVVFFSVAILVAFRLSDNRFAKLSQYLPFAIGLVILSFFGVGEFLQARGTLAKDATRRYSGVKDVVTGDFAPVLKALEERASAWQPSRKLWKNPKLLGYGYNYITENEIYPPHNMVILILCETGIVGLLLFVGILLYFCNLGNWKMTAENSVLFVSVLLPIFVLMLESHSMLIRRYFVLQLVMLAYTTNVVFDRRALNR